MKKIKMEKQTVLTFGQGFDLFYQNCKARNLREGTLRHYRDSYLQIVKYVDEDLPIEAIDKAFIERFFAALHDNPKLGDMSVYTYARDFKTIVGFWMNTGLLPYFKIKLPSADKEPIETYTDAELRILLRKPDVKKCSFTEYKTWVIINFLLSTGIRQNSLIHILIKDVDFESGVIHVNVTKNRKPLIIPMNADITQILREYLRIRKGSENDVLFCNQFGEPLARATLYHACYVYNKKRGVEKTGIHRFRHTFAKKWAAMGGNLVTLQKVLGHSSLAITQNYLNFLVSDMRRDIDNCNVLHELKAERIKMSS